MIISTSCINEMPTRMAPPHFSPAVELPIFVISLRRSTERRALMVQQFARLNLPFSFFDAIDAQQCEHPLQRHYRAQHSLLRKGRPLSAGEVACYASHYQLWQWCVEHQQPILIIEDDVILEDHFPQALAYISQHLHEYDYIRLARTFEVKKHPLSHRDSHYTLYKYEGKPCGTTGYLLHPKAARQLLRHSHRVTLPVDEFIDQEWRHGVAAIGVEPMPITITDLPSEIGQRRPEQPLSRVNRINREAFRCGYDLMGSLFNLRFRLRQKWRHKR